MNVRRRDERTKAETVLFVITGLLLVFIWGNSLLPADLSSDESSGLFELVKPILDFIFGRGVITHAIFRKLAHMSEFGVFTIFLTLIFKGGFPLLFAAAVACIDESIQIFTPGRGPAFRDVMIDMSGSLICFVLTFLILILVDKRRKASLIL